MACSHSAITPLGGISEWLQAARPSGRSHTSMLLAECRGPGSSRFRVQIAAATARVLLVFPRVCLGSIRHIVADSVPRNEYQETLNKARGMLMAIELAERGME